VEGSQPGNRPQSDLACRNGLPCLETIDDINIVVMPDGTSITDQKALVDHCEGLKDRFAIIDSPPEPLKDGDAHDVKLQAEKLVSAQGYAAIYHPWIEVQDPVTKKTRTVPPSGAVAGIYSRVDVQRGIHKAPSGEVVIGAMDVEVQRSQRDLSELSQLGVNGIRKFAGRGLLVWGSRTTSTDAIWKYVQVRRTIIYLERSIGRGTEWVTFEPHDKITWDEARRSVIEFLTGRWKDGMLLGTTPEEAFMVRCDRSTMTQKDIEEERLVIEVGVALMRPAEFIMFRILHQMERVGPRKLVDRTLDAPKKKKHYYTAGMKRME